MILFPISALKSLAIAIAMSVFFALILKIIYFVLLCTYFIPVALAFAQHHKIAEVLNVKTNFTNGHKMINQMMNLNLNMSGT